jgi:hypothetical protein
VITRRPKRYAANRRRLRPQTVLRPFCSWSLTGSNLLRHECVGYVFRVKSTIFPSDFLGENGCRLQLLRPERHSSRPQTLPFKPGPIVRLDAPVPSGMLNQMNDCAGLKCATVVFTAVVCRCLIPYRVEVTGDSCYPHIVSGWERGGKPYSNNPARACTVCRRTKNVSSGAGRKDVMPRKAAMPAPSAATAGSARKPWTSQCRHPLQADGVQVISLSGKTFFSSQINSYALVPH